MFSKFKALLGLSDTSQAQVQQTDRAIDTLERLQVLRGAGAVSDSVVRATSKALLVTNGSSGADRAHDVNGSIKPKQLRFEAAPEQNGGARQILQHNKAAAPGTRHTWSELGDRSAPKPAALEPAAPKPAAAKPAADAAAAKAAAAAAGAKPTARKPGALEPAAPKPAAAKAAAATAGTAKALVPARPAQISSAAAQLRRQASPTAKPRARALPSAAARTATAAAAEASKGTPMTLAAARALEALRAREPSRARSVRPPKN